MSEDCLYLNVTTPAEIPPGGLPVMVWIHGGGFTGGSGDYYDARRLAAEGKVAVVTINYRLGGLGFFGHQELAGAGALGLEDQQAALRWVRRNAGAFGGDPTRVTVFGESAGAMSICAHLVSPAAAGLFDRAILQSGSCLQTWPAAMIRPGGPAFEQFPAEADLAVRGAALAADLGCTGPQALACLRAAPGPAVLKAWGAGRPAWGGPILPRSPKDAFSSGAHHRVPLIWGATRDEWRPVAGMYARSNTFDEAAYRSLLHAAFGARAEAVARLYPTVRFGSPAYAWGAVATDRSWSCPTLASVQLAARYVPVHAFEFADGDAPNPNYPLPDGFDLGAGHATDLFSLFDLGGEPPPFSEAQRRLASRIVGYWSAFAASGDPNLPGLPAWPAARGKAERRALSLAPAPATGGLVDVATNHNCDFWAAEAAARSEEHPHE